MKLILPPFQVLHFSGPENLPHQFIKNRDLTKSECMRCTIVVVLILWAGSSGEVQGIRHGLGGHYPQQPVYQGVLWIHCMVQRISQSLVRPKYTQRFVGTLITHTSYFTQLQFSN